MLTHKQIAGVQRYMLSNIQIKKREFGPEIKVKIKYRSESIMVVGESCYLRHVTVLIYPSQKKSPLSVVSVKNIIFYFVLKQFTELLKIFYFFTFNMVRF